MAFSDAAMQQLAQGGINDVIRQAIDRLIVMENRHVTLASQVAEALNMIDDERKKNEASVSRIPEEDCRRRNRKICSNQETGR